MKSAIAIDRWKLPIFERHLKQSGYTYKQGNGLTSDTMILYIHTENMVALETVVRAANTEAAKTGNPNEQETLAALERAAMRWSQGMHLARPRCRCLECMLIRACRAHAKSKKGRK